MTAVVPANPKVQFCDALGVPLAVGTVDVYLAGTTTLTTTWQDKTKLSTNTNPILLDSRGECVIWGDSSVTYKYVLKNAAGVEQYTVDNIPGTADVGAAAVAAAAGALAAQTAAELAETHAETAQAAAEAARDAALAAARIYANTTAGLAAVASGEYFYVPSANASESLLLYLDSAGTAVLQKRYPSTTAMFDESKYAGSVSTKGGTFKDRNLFNLSTINSGYYQDASTGALVANAGYYVTDYIPVVPGTAIVCSHGTPVGSANAFAYFDYALSYVSGSAAELTAGTTTTVPANAAYVRLTFATSISTSLLVIVQGSAIPSRYTPWGEPYFANVLDDARSFDMAIRPKRQNLFDPDKRVTGHYIEYLTGASAAGTAFHTDYIPLAETGQFTLYPASSGVIAPGGLAYYNAEFVYISGVAGPFTSGQVLTAPAGARYFRITVNNSQVDTFTVLEGSQTPTDFLYHTAAFKSDVWQWHGKQFAILGDSLSDLTDWMTTVSATVGASVGLDAALSGRTMVDALKTRAGAALVSGDFTSIDFALLFLGTNDYGTAATTMGTIADSTATASFYGYTKKAVEQMLTWKPTLKIAIATLTPRNDVTAANAAGKVLTDYSAALRAVAERYGLPILDFEKLSGLNALTFSTYTTDNLHFNATGDAACIRGPALGFLKTVWPNS